MNNLKQFSLSVLKMDKLHPEIIAVTSGKGGVGKSNISVNLALLMSKMKKRVLLIDADIHLGNVDLLLGIRPNYSIADVIKGEVEMKDVITKGPGGIDILPAGSAILDMLDLENNILQKLGDSFSQFDHQYDTVIVDTGAGIHNAVMSFVVGADKIILVVTPDPASIADSYGMVKVIRHSNPHVPVVMVSNMVENEENGESMFKKMNLMVQRFLNSSLIYGGSIVKDNLIQYSVQKQKPVSLFYPNSVPVNSLRMITRRLMKMPVTDTKKRDSFFERFMNYKHVEIEPANG
jgi:flagellar biosynthesis protein FlhG